MFIVMRNDFTFLSLDDDTFVSWVPTKYAKSMSTQFASRAEAENTIKIHCTDTTYRYTIVDFEPKGNQLTFSLKEFVTFLKRNPLLQMGNFVQQCWDLFYDNKLVGKITIDNYIYVVHFNEPVEVRE